MMSITMKYSIFFSLLFAVSSSTLSFLSHLSIVTATTTFDGLSLIPSPPVRPIFNFTKESNLMLHGRVALVLVPNQLALNQWFCPEPYTPYSNLIKVFQSQLTCVNFSQTSTRGDDNGLNSSEYFTANLDSSGAGSSRAGDDNSNGESDDDDDDVDSDGGSDDDDDDDGDKSFLLWLLPQFLKDWWKDFCRQYPDVCEMLKMLGAVWWLLEMLNDQHGILTTLCNIYRACLESPWYILLLIPTMAICQTVAICLWRSWSKDVAATKKGKAKKKSKE